SWGSTARGSPSAPRTARRSTTSTSARRSGCLPRRGGQGKRSPRRAPRRSTSLTGPTAWTSPPTACSRPRCAGRGGLARRVATGDAVGDGQLGPVGPLVDDLAAAHQEDRVARVVPHALAGVSHAQLSGRLQAAGQPERRPRALVPQVLAGRAGLL